MNFNSTTKFVFANLVWINVAAGVVVSTGCTSARFFRSETATVPEPPAVSPHEAISAFEQQRIDALYKSARSSWKSGDLQPCEASLRQILRLDRQHKAARLMLADLFAETDRVDGAIEQLQDWLATSPDDMQVQQALDLLLELAGEQETTVAKFSISDEE